MLRLQHGNMLWLTSNSMRMIVVHPLIFVSAGTLLLRERASASVYTFFGNRPVKSPALFGDVCERSCTPCSLQHSTRWPQQPAATHARSRFPPETPACNYEIPIRYNTVKLPFSSLHMSYLQDMQYIPTCSGKPQPRILTHIKFFHLFNKSIHMHDRSQPLLSPSHPILCRHFSFPFPSRATGFAHYL